MGNVKEILTLVLREQQIRNAPMYLKHTPVQKSNTEDLTNLMHVHSIQVGIYTYTEVYTSNIHFY